jgi:hypothetical protein
VVVLLALNFLSVLFVGPKGQPRVAVPFSPYFFQQLSRDGRPPHFEAVVCVNTHVRAEMMMSASGADSGSAVGGQVGGDVGQRVGAWDEPKCVAPPCVGADIGLQRAWWVIAAGGGGRVGEQVLKPLPREVSG